MRARAALLLLMRSSAASTVSSLGGLAGVIYQYGDWSKVLLNLRHHLLERGKVINRCAIRVGSTAHRLDLPNDLIG